MSFIKPNYDDKVKLYHVDSNSFTVYIKTDNIYKNIAQNVETTFDTSKYELDRPLPKGKN